jgi:hypothetical protein
LAKNGHERKLQQAAVIGELLDRLAEAHLAGELDVEGLRYDA